MPAPPADPALLEEAVELASAAGDLTLQWFGTNRLEIEIKADDTPVTVADRQAERLIRQALSARHPDDGVIGEEEGIAAGSSGRRWVIDPIDGTYGFVHGVPLYCTLLAVLDEHGPVVGVIHLPALGETVYAGRSLGCTVRDVGGVRPASVNAHRSLDGAAVMSSGVDHWPPGALDRIHAGGAKIRTWGDGYGYALVATGRVEAMVDPVVSVWDLAPLPVIIGEAGGRFSTLDGREDLWGGSGVATNGLIHAELLAAVGGGPA
jgi:histidinol phosphatase-like enzyme (inositol monophosphatase family)